MLDRLKVTLGMLCIPALSAAAFNTGIGVAVGECVSKCGFETTSNHLNHS